MGDHFEHVGYRYRPERTHFWRMVDPDDYESDEAYHDEMEHLADRGWQVERLYRRCKGEARYESL